MNDTLEQSQHYQLIERAIRYIEENVQRQPELEEIASAIGPAQLRALVRAISHDLAGDNRPRAIELVGAINRLLEAAGLNLEFEETHAQPAPLAKSQSRTAAAS